MRCWFDIMSKRPEANAPASIARIDFLVQDELEDLTRYEDVNESTGPPLDP